MATKQKPYKPKSLEAATRRCRELKRQVEACERYMATQRAELILLAKLSADGPTFTNVLEIAAAKKVRNEWLALACGLNPDGTPIQRRTP